MLANSLIGFTLFQTYTITESTLRYFPSDTLPPYLIPLIAGATAGAAQSIISSPLDNIRALLAPSPATSLAAQTKQWQGWRSIAVQALFPNWLTSSTSVKSNPIRFLVNWWRSSWSLFIFTLLRDSIGFSAFFAIYDLSRTLGKRAGKAVDRYQTLIEQRSRDMGISLQDLLDNDMLGRGWPGRVVQALVIVFCGVLAGVSYGLVGRPFDKARTVIWKGFEEWAQECRRHVRAEKGAQLQRQLNHKNAGRRGSDAIGTVPRTADKTAAYAIPRLVTHRWRHTRLIPCETRLPLRPPRSAKPSKHPLKEPSVMHPFSPASPASNAVPSSFRLLREAYEREGRLAMLGFSTVSSSFLGSLMRPKADLSRAQLAKSNRAKVRPAQSAAARRASPLTLGSLSEHPSLGGTSVYSDLPIPNESSPKQEHRKMRWWQINRRNQRFNNAAAHVVEGGWTRKVTFANVFRIVPPYCVGFLVYALLADDF